MFEEDMKLLGQRQKTLLLMAQQETWASAYLYHFLLSQVLQRMMQIGPKEMSEHKVACAYLIVLYCILYYRKEILSLGNLYVLQGMVSMTALCSRGRYSNFHGCSLYKVLENISGGKKTVPLLKSRQWKIHRELCPNITLICILPINLFLVHRILRDFTDVMLPI